MVGCCELRLRSTPRYRLVCICFPPPGRGLPYGSGLGLSRCQGPGECLHSFIHSGCISNRPECNSNGPGCISNGPGWIRYALGPGTGKEGVLMPLHWIKTDGHKRGQAWGVGWTTQHPTATTVHGSTWQVGTVTHILLPHNSHRFHVFINVSHLLGKGLLPTFHPPELLWEAPPAYSNLNLMGIT